LKDIACIIGLDHLISIVTSNQVTQKLQLKFQKISNQVGHIQPRQSCHIPVLSTLQLSMAIETYRKKERFIITGKGTVQNDRYKAKG
jgi:hypothetical protein